MEKFIHIRSKKFPILPGEEEELVNEGMYGKALAEYLQKQLTGRGYNALALPRFGGQELCKCVSWGSNT